MNGLQIPDCDEFLRGGYEYERNEHRGHVYFDALSHIKQNWGNPEEMASGNYICSILEKCGLVRYAMQGNRKGIKLP